MSPIGSATVTGALYVHHGQWDWVLKSKNYIVPINILRPYSKLISKNVSLTIIYRDRQKFEDQYGQKQLVPVISVL